MRFANGAAETMLDFSLRTTRGQRFSALLVNGSLVDDLFADARRLQYANKRLDFALHRPGREPIEVHGIVTALHDDPETPVVFEMQEADRQRRIDRVERIQDQSAINRELIRNLAHEIKNPLGGIRGAAQLLQMEIAAPAAGGRPARAPSAEFLDYAQRHHQGGGPAAEPRRPAARAAPARAHRRRRQRPRGLRARAQRADGRASGGAATSSATTTPAFPSSAATRNS